MRCTQADHQRLGELRGQAFTDRPQVLFVRAEPVTQQHQLPCGAGGLLQDQRCVGHAGKAESPYGCQSQGCTLSSAAGQVRSPLDRAGPSASAQATVA